MTVNASGANDAIAVGGDGSSASNANEFIVNFAQGGSLSEQANSRADVYGGGVTAALVGTDTFGLYGAGETINASGTGNQIWTGQNGQTATGANIDAVNFAQAGYVYEMVGTNLNVTGNGATVTMTSSDTLTLSGSSEAVQFGTQTTGDVLNGFSSTDSLQFSKTDFASFSVLLTHANQVGANTVITLDANDTVTLAGVTKSALVSGEFRFV